MRMINEMKYFTNNGCNFEIWEWKDYRETILYIKNSVKLILHQREFSLIYNGGYEHYKALQTIKERLKSIKLDAGEYKVVYNFYLNDSGIREIAVYLKKLKENKKND